MAMEGFRQLSYQLSCKWEGWLGETFRGITGIESVPRAAAAGDSDDRKQTQCSLSV
jgi:hypothetical protein